MDHTLHAGAAEMVVTPPVGLGLGGWAVRAAGDNFSRFVHDDLHVRALTMSRAGKSWMFILGDVVSIDPVAVDGIRRGIAAETDMVADSIMVCATHCHSAPRLHHSALACSREELLRKSPQNNGLFRGASVKAIYPSTAGTIVTETIDEGWRTEFIRRTIATGIEAVRMLRPAEVTFVENNVPGVASSRRVRLSDGSWADPRRERAPDAVEVSRTEPDHTIRIMLARERDTGRPIAALMNFGCHPWIFPGAGMSAELSGYVSRKVAAAWTFDGVAPVALFGSGPAGDVTAIWNIDLANLWQTRPGETPEESFARRQARFGVELDRLGGILAEGTMAAIGKADNWTDASLVDSKRRQVELPLKKGVDIPSYVHLAGWQKNAPAGRHITELQVLRIGDDVILGMPGEPFTSIGREIRRGAKYENLMIFEQANDGGVVGYVPDRDSFEAGGYEVDNFPLDAGAGEMVVEQSLALLDA